MTNDFTQSSPYKGKSRLEIITERQIRFIHDMHNAQEISAKKYSGEKIALELRYISRPNTTCGNCNIDIVFIGKAFHSEEEYAKKLCLQLWNKFIAHFPLEAPFNYPVEIIQPSNAEYYLSPIQKPLKHILEICKYEDFDQLTGNDRIGYFPHQFLPAFDASALGRFLETLARQEQKCVVSIGIHPSKLYEEEEKTLKIKLYNDYQRVNEPPELGRESGAQEAILQNHTTDNVHVRDRKGVRTWLQLHLNERLTSIHNAFLPLFKHRYHLFEIKIQVVGEKVPPVALLESLGSELLGNNCSKEPKKWSKMQPEEAIDLRIASSNFEYLNFDRREKDDKKRLNRLKYLVTPLEAAGAFRLPIPPESGYLPGLLVRDEPFVQPQNVLKRKEPAISLGKIIHHGQITEKDFTISIGNLSRHMLIAGATGSGKTYTCLHLLSQLWTKHKKPFLVMYPIDKPDYRLLMADPRVSEKLLIYTVGDETTSPFRFNPFYVPDNILLKTHTSLLMRCFSAAFSMWDPLPAIYRTAIRQAYESKGWNIDHDTGGTGRERGLKTPTMSYLYDVLVEVTERMTAQFDEEAKGRVKQSAEIRLHDLLLNTGMIINSKEPAPIEQ
ncbi:MAG: DUF87 domain-containing protein, partial [Candidatus Electrothrix sp. AR1]|nr:DUF87 domain-containing protein [Candidatus Electrothrix sp. AR1]